MIKRFAILLLCICLLTAAAVSASADGEDRLDGDTNGDGIVSAADAALILRYVVGLDDGLYAGDMLRADVNGNGEVDADDAASILRYVARLAPLSVVGTNAEILDLLRRQSTLGEEETEWAARLIHALPANKRKTVICIAANYMGVPYGTGDGQLDCSKFLRTAFENAGVPATVYPHTNSHGTLVWFRAYHPERLHETDPSQWRSWRPGCVLIYVNPATERGSHVALYVCSIDGNPIVMESRRAECDGVRIGVLMGDEERCVLSYYADPFQ